MRANIEMNFETEFKAWLSKSLGENVPNSVQAFSFNLFEPELTVGVKFGIELVGADRFDKEDEDWACEEVWNPVQRRLFIPIEYSGDSWEECLKKMKALLMVYLEGSSAGADQLKSVKGVGIGFVDGNLDLILQP